MSLKRARLDLLFDDHCTQLHSSFSAKESSQLLWNLIAICPSPTFLCIVQLTPLFLSLPVLSNSAGIPSGPIALPTFSASIAFVISLSRIQSPLKLHLHQAPIQFPSLHSEVAILVIQSLNILLPSVPYLFWFCQQFSCFILYCITWTVSRVLSHQLSNLCLH